MMSPQLTRKFADMIRDYNRKVIDIEARFGNEEEHENLCVAMFRSVLTPYVYKYDDEIMWDNFARHLVVQTLDSAPGLRTLHLALASREDEPAVLARMAYSLTHLQKFTYVCDCTDEVIEQLALHSTRLIEVDLYLSRGVTNASVQHLLRLRKLQFINVEGTEIDNKHYGLLLSELPIIKNIKFRLAHENILDYVAEKKLQKISHVSGQVPNIHMLTQRCPNVTNLDIDTTTGDMSALAALTTLRTVEIIWVDYAVYNLNAVLTGIGPRLSDLTLTWVTRVNLQDIVTLCPSLESLSLLECKLLPLNPDTQLNPQLPHFRNLTFLHIINIDEDETIYSYIRHYVSLKRIRLEAIHIFTAEFMRKVVSRGTLANLEQFYLQEYWPCASTMEALEMLIQHCSHLKSIGYLGTYRRLDEDPIQQLKHRLVVQNLDLQIIS
jgi:hypothetical protein